MKLSFCEGTINGKPARILLDGGAQGLFVNSKYIKHDQRQGPTIPVVCAFSEKHDCHRTSVDLNCPYYKGSASAYYRSDVLYDALLGRIPGTKQFPGTLEPIELDKTPHKAALKHHELTDVNDLTKQSICPQRKEICPLESNGEIEYLLPDSVTLRRAQQECPTLEFARNNIGKELQSGENAIISERSGLLYQDHETNEGIVHKLIVPAKFRRMVMYAGHTIPLSGHIAHEITYRRIARHYTWPNMTNDVKLYVRNCCTCQMSGYSSRPELHPTEVTNLADNTTSQDFTERLPLTPAQVSLLVSNKDPLGPSIEEVTPKDHVIDPESTTENQLSMKILLQKLNDILKRFCSKPNIGNRLTTKSLR